MTTELQYIQKVKGETRVQHNYIITTYSSPRVELGVQHDSITTVYNNETHYGNKRTGEHACHLCWALSHLFIKVK